MEVETVADRRQRAGW